MHPRNIGWEYAVLVCTHRIYKYQISHSNVLRCAILLWTLGTILPLIQATHPTRHKHNSTFTGKTQWHIAKGDKHFNDHHNFVLAFDKPLYPVDTWQIDLSLSDTVIAVRDDPIDTTQCIQIIVTGTIAAVTCNLPAHCGSVVYNKVSSTWWGTETGVCVGMGQKPMAIRFNKGLQLPKGWKKFQHVTTQIAHEYSLFVLER